MAHRDIVTIGGSAGSIESLKTILKALPGSLAAAIFVIIHRNPFEKSWLAQVLNRVSELPSAEAVDSERIESGRIYLAPPDCHLLLAEDHIHLTHGPKEGRHRPSINVTFRSAARAYGERVTGILLSGMLDDGASGLWDIVHRGGVSIVQDPEEAQFPSIPLEALKDVPINYSLRSSEIAKRLRELVEDIVTPSARPEKFINNISPEYFSGFTCPECRGPLYSARREPPEFKCRTGHIFPLTSLIEHAAATRESKMYEAIVSLEEGADIDDLAANEADLEDRGRFIAEAQQLRRFALAIRKLVEEPSALAEWKTTYRN